ncbi:MAG: hypothetical protein CM1200mP41_17640 [Gammaproteobacteria bacterium]|nr:MAG: hypothetical protein CM1200mP41_17640 [Gammaproteobacteria bacterium]
MAVRYVDSETLVEEGSESFDGVDAILIPGGFGGRGIEGMIAAVRYAREGRIPYLGICLGLQIAVIECARHQVAWLVRTVRSLSRIALTPLSLWSPSG